MATELLTFNLIYSTGLWLYTGTHPNLSQPLTLGIYRKGKPTGKQLRKRRNRAHKRWHQHKVRYREGLKLAVAVKGEYCHITNNVGGASSRHIEVARRRIAQAAVDEQFRKKGTDWDSYFLGGPIRPNLM